MPIHEAARHAGVREMSMAMIKTNPARRIFSSDAAGRSLDAPDRRH